MRKASPSKKPSDVVSIRAGRGGLLATLRSILQRRKAKASTPQQPAAPAHNAPGAADRPDHSRRLNQMIAMLSAPKAASHEPKPAIIDALKDDDKEDGDEDEDDEAESSDDENTNHSTTTVQSKKTKPKKKKKKKNRWVRQLLNQQVEKKKDRAPVARKKCHQPLKSKGPARPPALFTVVNPFTSSLVAQILLFLEIRQPAAVCAYVNKACEAHVNTFYERHCPHPRPRRYLAKKIFITVDSRERIPEKILSFLDIDERVNASSCCQTLFQAANTLALTIKSSQNAARFVECVPAERVEVRFNTTSTLELGTRSAILWISCILTWLQGYLDLTYIRCVCLEDMDAEFAVEVVKLMDTGETECFASLSELTLRRIRGFSTSEALFVQLIQVLFADRVSHKLCSLELSGI